MHHTVELLIQGDRGVCDYYRAAVERWREIWARPEAGDPVRLATVLSGEQTWFERHCGPREHRWVGQEVMVAAGFGMLYSTRAGFDDNAERAQLLYDAFQRSFCSIEVKGVARDVASSYGLLEERVA